MVLILILEHLITRIIHTFSVVMFRIAEKMKPKQAGNVQESGQAGSLLEG